MNPAQAKPNTPSGSGEILVNMSPIQLKPKHMEALSDISESDTFDQTFIYYLLEALFEKDELRNGSYGGSRSNNNGACHEQLDLLKIGFIEGKVLRRILVISNIH